MLATAQEMYTIAEKLANNGEKVSSFSERWAGVAVFGLLLSGCATGAGVARTPAMSDRHLRPMNQDLALWLERVNAKPAGETAMQHQVSAIALASEPAPQQAKTAPPLPPALPIASVAPSSAPSPTASLAVQPATEVKPRPASTSPDSTVVSGDTSSPSAAPTEVAAALASSHPKEKTAPAAAAADSPPPKPSAQPPANPPKPTWVANPGSTVRETLAHWSSEAGWAVPQWDAEIDYQVPGTLSFEGDFLDAVRGLFKAYARAKRPLLVDAYPNQKIIHVTE